MIFGLMLTTVLLITHVKKQRNRKCKKWDKCLQITTSPISKSQKALPFPPHRLSDISISIHVHNRFALQQTYCEHDYGSRYWIWMNSYWMFESLCGRKGAVSVILKLDLLWFEGIYLFFGIVDFFVFWRG